MHKILIALTFLAAACTDTTEPDMTADADSHHPHPDAGPADASPPPDATPDAAPDASTHCGELGELCCEVGQGCNGGPHSDIYCSTGGICMAPVPDCGGEGQACCNPLCFPGGGCITWPCENNAECQADVCVIVPSPPGCGAQNEACCFHPGTQISFCDQGLDCDGEAPDGTRICI